MEPITPSLLLILSLFFIVAFLYSSVGHGGASGYLAVLSFFAFAPTQMSTTALVLNVVVAGTAAIAFARAGHLSSSLTLPFLFLSVPLAFIGGTLQVSRSVYALLLGFVLIVAAARLAMEFRPPQGTVPTVKLPSLPIALAVGGAIGLLSGIVGVGGGIFLSPLILLIGWADPKRTAATSAVFIVLNSIAGLVGRATGQAFSFGELLPYLSVTILGGYLGSRFGSTKFSNLVLRRVLALVLLTAATKLLMSV